MLQTVARKLIPIGAYQHPMLSLQARLLLAYLTFADDDGVVRLSTERIAILVGEVGPDGIPTEKQISNVRRSRHLLAKRGHLHHIRIPIKGSRKTRDAWWMAPVELTGSAIDLLSELGKRNKDAPVTYTNARWHAPEGVEPVEESRVDSLLEDDIDIDTLLAD